MPRIFDTKEIGREGKEDYYEEDKNSNESVASLRQEHYPDTSSSHNDCIRQQRANATSSSTSNGRRGSISHSLIKYKTGEYDLELVKRLDLQENDLKYLENLEECPNLIDLNLSKNLIKNLNFGLQYNVFLKRLDLSYNQITDLKYNGNNISLHLTNLEYLNLQGNRIASFDDCLDCLKSLCKLSTLYLRENPLAQYTSPSSSSIATLDNSSTLVSNSNQLSGFHDRPNYFQVLITNLRSLEILDGECVRMRQMTESRLAQLLHEIEPDEEARKDIPRSPWLDSTELRRQIEIIDNHHLREGKSDDADHDDHDKQQDFKTKDVEEQERQLTDTMSTYMDNLESMKSKAESLLSNLQNEVNHLNSSMGGED